MQGKAILSSNLATLNIHAMNIRTRRYFYFTKQAYIIISIVKRTNVPYVLREVGEIHFMGNMLNPHNFFLRINDKV